MIRARVPIAAFLVLTAALSLQAADNTPLGEKKTRAALAKAATTVAGKGHAAAAEELLAIAETLGHPTEAVAKARATAQKKLAKHRGEPKPVKSTVRAIQRATSELSVLLPGAKGEDRERLLDAIVRLDSDDEQARAARGEMRVDGGWSPEQLAPLLERREEIRRKLDEARRLDVEVKLGPGRSKLLAAVVGEPGRTASVGRVHLHALGMNDAKMRRIITNAMRAHAFSQFLLHGKVVATQPRTDVHLTVYPSSPQYEQGVAAARKAGRMSPEQAALAVQASHWVASQAERLSKPLPEAHYVARLFADVMWDVWYGERSEIPQPTLYHGHTNWVARSMMGVGLISLGVSEKKAGERSGATSDAGSAREDPREIWKLGDAGLLGARSWLRYLTARGEDPAWSRSFQDQEGKIQGDVATKATFAVEYLQETGQLLKIMQSTEGKPHGIERFEKALGTDLATFEAAWDRWMLAPDDRRGVVQVLSADRPTAVSPELRELIAHLNALRKSAASTRYSTVDIALSLDAELSRGCAAHGRYLLQNREQLAAWPDAHEEWPDRPGFSTDGSWAGLHSVIVGGVHDWQSALESWMGTFYHRLPLLDPGLVRIGWALEKDVAVLDAASMVRNPLFTAWTVWPPPDATDVPRSFNPELPNPVPGEDQSKWGYPVTVQVAIAEYDTPFTVELFKGESSGGDPVDCYVSTPRQPTNPELAPSEAVCLIPKSTLAAGTTYCVRLSGLPNEAPLEWTFRTGR